MIYDFQRFLSLRLLLWALVSIFGGCFFLISGDSFWRGFGLQAVIWGTIDAGIAFWGQRGLSKRINAPFDPAEAAQKNRWLRRVLVINAGLDIFYTAAGIVLALTLGRWQPFQAGMGWGIVLQGIFLLVFDSLHAWRIPAEIFLPDWGLFHGAEHQSFERKGGSPAALFIHGFPDTPFAMSDLADSLYSQGWTVSGLLLPGFGPQLKSLYQQRVEFWIDAISQEIERLKKDHDPVILVGFSLGGGLAVPAALRTRPDGLVLLAPFCLPHPAWLSAAYILARIFLPFSITVGPFIALVTEEITQGFNKLIPDISFSDPVVQETLRKQRIPLISIEQFLHLSRTTYACAPQWQGPTLIIQGANDTTVRPAWSRQLKRRLGGHPELVIVPGNHNLNLPGHASYSQVTAQLEKFASSICQE